MADDLLARVNAMRAAIATKDLDALVAISDPEIELRSFFAMAAGGGYHGYEGLREYVRDLDEAWESLVPEIDDTLVVGDVVLAVGRLHYRGRGSGIDTEATSMWVFGFRGQLLSVHSFSDPERTLLSLGVRD